MVCLFAVVLAGNAFVTASAAAIEPDNLPALNFAEGAVVKDVSVLARAKNLAIGCRVEAVRSVRGVMKGARGTLKGLGKEALVPYFVPYFDHTLTW